MPEFGAWDGDEHIAVPLGVNDSVSLYSDLSLNHPSQPLACYLCNSKTFFVKFVKRSDAVSSVEIRKQPVRTSSSRMLGHCSSERAV
ncbi:hypothetical protein CDAR_292991 [Caerostris darwini]|uniref:RIN4 pathogenic type III effector avirulence factor Avr cleavage site domain-containing protein n=1 Tax=Caerostris darwini TaxID=1538125 RepID=A0AAV4TMW9_9ARAC|nr:hypothetical protein CDAR_292991 [Caerostris darwini]